MSGMRPEGDADATHAEPARLDGGVSGMPEKGVSEPGRDGLEPSEDGGAAAAEATAAGRGESRPLTDAEQYWSAAAGAAETVTPLGLGEYLTGLVATKNRDFPDDHAEFLACGILGTIHALRQTHPEIGTVEAMQGLTYVLQRLWLGWPTRR